MKDCLLLLSGLACCKMNEHVALNIFSQASTNSGHSATYMHTMDVCRLQECELIEMIVCFCACMHAQSCTLLTSA